MSTAKVCVHCEYACCMWYDSFVIGMPHWPDQHHCADPFAGTDCRGYRATSMLRELTLMLYSRLDAEMRIKDLLTYIYRRTYESLFY